MAPSLLTASVSSDGSDASHTVTVGNQIAAVGSLLCGAFSGRRKGKEPARGEEGYDGSLSGGASLGLPSLPHIHSAPNLTSYNRPSARVSPYLVTPSPTTTNSISNTGGTGGTGDTNAGSNNNNNNSGGTANNFSFYHNPPVPSQYSPPRENIEPPSTPRRHGTRHNHGHSATTANSGSGSFTTPAPPTSSDGSSDDRSPRQVRGGGGGGGVLGRRRAAQGRPPARRLRQRSARGSRGVQSSTNSQQDSNPDSNPEAAVPRSVRAAADAAVVDAVAGEVAAAVRSIAAAKAVLAGAGAQEVTAGGSSGGNGSGNLASSSSVATTRDHVAENVDDIVASRMPHGFPTPQLLPRPVAHLPPVPIESPVAGGRSSVRGGASRQTAATRGSGDGGGAVGGTGGGERHPHHRQQQVQQQGRPSAGSASYIYGGSDTDEARREARWNAWRQQLATVSGNTRTDPVLGSGRFSSDRNVGSGVGAPRPPPSLMVDGQLVGGGGGDDSNSNSASDSGSDSVDGGGGVGGWGTGYSGLNPRTQRAEFEWSVAFVGTDGYNAVRRNESSSSSSGFERGSSGAGYSFGRRQYTSGGCGSGSDSSSDGSGSFRRASSLVADYHNVDIEELVGSISWTSEASDGEGGGGGGGDGGGGGGRGRSSESAGASAASDPGPGYGSDARNLGSDDDASAARRRGSRQSSHANPSAAMAPTLENSAGDGLSSRHFLHPNTAATGHQSSSSHAGVKSLAHPTAKDSSTATRQPTSHPLSTYGSLPIAVQAAVDVARFVFPHASFDDILAIAALVEFENSLQPVPSNLAGSVDKQDATVRTLRVILPHALPGDLEALAVVICDEAAQLGGRSCQPTGLALGSDGTATSAATASSVAAATAAAAAAAALHSSLSVGGGGAGTSAAAAASTTTTTTTTTTTHSSTTVASASGSSASTAPSARAKGAELPGSALQALVTGGRSGGGGACDGGRSGEPWTQQRRGRSAKSVLAASVARHLSDSTTSSGSSSAAVSSPELAEALGESLAMHLARQAKIEEDDRLFALELQRAEDVAFARARDQHERDYDYARRLEVAERREAEMLEAAQQVRDAVEDAANSRRAAEEVLSRSATRAREMVAEAQAERQRRADDEFSTMWAIEEEALRVIASETQPSSRGRVRRRGRGGGGPGAQSGRPPFNANANANSNSRSSRSNRSNRSGGGSSSQNSTGRRGRRGRSRGTARNNRRGRGSSGRNVGAGPATPAAPAAPARRKKAGRPLPRVENFMGVLSEDTACTICLDDMSAGSRAAIFPCGHGFHSACAKSWLVQQPRCPNCRRSLG